MRPICAALVAIPLVAVASAQTVNLQFRPTVGKPYNYAMRVDQAGKNIFTIQMRMKAIKEAGGISTVVTTIPGMTSMGRPAPPQIAQQFAKLKVTTTQNRTGRVLTQNVEGAPPGFQNPAAGASVAYPARPLRIGESWTGEVKSAQGTYRTTYRLLKVGSYKGVKAAQIEAVPKAPAAGVKLSPIKYWVETSSGMPLSFDFTAEARGQKVRTRMDRV